MQLQDVELVASGQSETLCYNTEPQHTDKSVLKLCVVKLVDIRKVHTMNLNLSEENLPTEGDSSIIDGDRETIQNQLKMISVKLVDCIKAKADQDPSSRDFRTSSEFTDKSNRFDVDQQTLRAQLKLALVRLVDCKKVPGTQAAEVEPEDGDHEFNNNSSRDQQTLPAQLKMSSVRLVDCGKIQSQNSAAVDELEGKSSRIDKDQQTPETQLKMCLVRLVDCGKTPDRKTAAKGEPGDKPNYVFWGGTNQPSNQEVKEQSNKRQSDQHVTFGKSSNVGKSVAHCKEQRVYRGSLDFSGHQNAHTEEKQYDCTQCGQEFSPPSRLRRHPRMERIKSVSNSTTGLWDCPRFKYSKDTQELMQVMMREARLTNFQQRLINNELKKGGALPLICDPTSPTAPEQPKRGVSKQTVLSSRPQRRSAEQCKAGDNYTRERFRPSATRNLEKEKHRLQSILATGQEEIQPSSSQTGPSHGTEESEKDRFQEVLDEIEERREFLEEMYALGRGRQYHQIINTEISQKIRELELIDKARSEALRMKKEEKEKIQE
ncbi:UPF0193 protein EVG1 [Bagarius yarrelli]|uniref:UPF0193 protein EVG1 n=1 Tax=Bagarius yarrelli TaxID=175774 RepID=A0A556TTC7_BAGYA|nr:UPF0193 protein EVG1 [Bagarius yarrelli]